jgi:exopolysaccharide production protein ExoQ
MRLDCDSFTLTWSVYGRHEPEQMGEHTVKHPQAGQSADPLSSGPRVNIVRSRVHSVKYSLLFYAASVFFLLHSMSALSIIDRAIYGEWYGKTGDKITATLNLLSIFASLFLCWSGTRLRIARFNQILSLAAASLFLITVLWSLDPRLTLTQGTAYFFVVLGAIGLVETLDSDELMNLIALICGLAAVASVVQFFIFPDPFHRGIFSTKNTLGQVMAAGVLTGLHGAQIRGGRWFRNICIIALCTIVAFMSKSATSVLAIAVFFWLGILGRIYLRGGSFRIISIFLAIGCVPIVIFGMYSDLIFELFGKDMTLTGRTDFWPYVIDNISKKPLLGWGFYAFWSPLNPIALQIAEAFRVQNSYGVTDPIANAHNTLLELLLEIGFLGTSVFIFLWLRSFIMAMKCMNGPAGAIGLSSVLVLTGILVIGFSEAVLLSHEQIWTSLFFIMGFICEKKLWLARAARRRGRPPPRSTLAKIAISRSAIM